MKKQLQISAAVLAASLSVNVMANNAGSSDHHKLGNAYLTVQTGLAFLNGADKLQEEIAAPSSSKLNLAVGAGIGYAFNVLQSDAGTLSVGPEFNYNYLGYLKFSDSDNNSLRINYSEWNILAKINYAVMNKYDLFVAGGMAQTPYTLGLPSYNSHIAAKVSPNLTGEIQVGAGYHFAKNWVVSLKYAHIFGDSADKVLNSFVSDSAKNIGKNPLAFDKVLAGITYKF